jgi:hypothetical protein
MTEKQPEIGNKKKFEPDDPEQSARFVELAKQIQADDAEERFEEAMRLISTAKRKKSDERDAQ